MPSQLQATPISAATTTAVAGRAVICSAVAAGPISSAVLRIAPMVSEDSATASARANR